MLVSYRSNSFKTICENRAKAARKYGYINADLISLRIQQIQAARTIKDLRALPQVRFHDLKGDRNGQYGMDLNKAQRLVVELETEQDTLTEDQVEEIILIEVEDYH